MVSPDPDLLLCTSAWVCRVSLPPEMERGGPRVLESLPEKRGGQQRRSAREHHIRHGGRSAKSSEMLLRSCKRPELGSLLQCRQLGVDAGARKYIGNLAFLLMGLSFLFCKVKCAVSSPQLAQACALPSLGLAPSLWRYGQDCRVSSNHRCSVPQLYEKGLEGHLVSFPHLVSTWLTCEGKSASCLKWVPKTSVEGEG